MKILKPLLPAALFGLAVFALAGITAVGADPGADRPQADPESDKAAVDPLGEYDLVPNKDHPGFIARVYKWTKDIARFDAGLRQLVATAKVPSKEELKKRLESKTGDLEIITDGYGGVVDFDAAEGTAQYVVNKRFADMNIEWEFELANDTKIHWDKSTKLIPEIARTTRDGKQAREQPFFTISIAKTDAGPFHSGDRVRLKASIDDFSRFRKDFFRAFGLVAIYYLDEAPNPVFNLRLDEAEVTLIKGDNQDASKNEPAKPEGTTEKVAGENGHNELEQLLEDAEERQLTYSPDKKILAHLDGHVVTVWSVEEKRQLHRFVLEGRPLVAAFSPDGGSLVTADGEGNLEYRSTVNLWSLATGERRLIAQFLGVPTHFSFSPDGSRLAAASNLNFIGSITRNPEGGIAPDRIQTGGSIHVWQVSNGDELMKVDIELPEYTAKLMQFQRAGADDPDVNKEKATDALQTAYYEAVRKRVPYSLNFSPDSQRLIAVSKSGEETIFDSQTGKPLLPTSRGEKDGDDQPATALELKSEGKEALGNGAFAFETPEPQEAEKQTEEVARQPYMDVLPDEVSAMADLWRIDPDLDRLLETPAENNRHPNSLRLSFAVPGAQVLRKETISLIEDLFVKKIKHKIIAVGKWEAEKDSKLAADRNSNCFVTTKNGATYLWFGTPGKSLVGVEANHIRVSTRKSLLILDGNSMLPPRMRKPENVRAYRSVYWNESAADEPR